MQPAGIQTPCFSACPFSQRAFHVPTDAPLQKGKMHNATLLLESTSICGKRSLKKENKETFVTS